MRVYNVNGKPIKEAELRAVGWSSDQLKELDEWGGSSDKPQHPLLNPESKHYQMLGGVEAIELMEAMFTREELMAWAKLTSYKYRLRIGKKDDPTDEVTKIRGYEAYYHYLEAKNVDK